MLKVITNVSPTGLFVLVFVCVMLVLGAFIWAEMLRIRHQQEYIIKRLNGWNDVDMYFTKGREDKTSIKFKKPFTDETRS
jgi:hypothetical protein